MSENSRKEIQKLYELLNKRKSDHESNMQRMQRLRQDNSILENENRRLCDQSTIVDRSVLLEREIADLKSERDMFKQQATRNSDLLTQKNNQLVEKIQELESLKLKYEEALTKLEDLNTSLINKLMND